MYGFTKGSYDGDINVHISSLGVVQCSETQTPKENNTQHTAVTKSKVHEFYAIYSFLGCILELSGLPSLRIEHVNIDHNEMFDLAELNFKLEHLNLNFKLANHKS